MNYQNLSQKNSYSHTAIFFLVVMSSLFILWGCGSDRFEANTDLKQFQAHYDQQEKALGQPKDHLLSPETIGSDQNTSDYLLGPGDLISVTVFQTDELNTEARLSSRGTVSLPMLGPINVEGLSAAQAEEKIESILKIKHLRDPHVTIHIKEYVSNQITLVGAFNTPGTFDYVRQRKLLDVIAIGGGITQAGDSVAFVTRRDKATGKTTTYKIDLTRMTKKGDMTQNITILGGDAIFVPAAGHCYIDGAVRKPGTYSIKDQITVTEAIALAGGLAPWAETDDIKLIRHTKNGERIIVQLNYSELHGKLKNTLILQDQDVIYAESSSTGKLFSGTKFELGFMGTGVEYKDPQK